MKLEQWKRSERNGLGAALLLVALGCGKASSPPTSGSEVAAASETQLPSGGRAVAELSLSSVEQLQLDASGVIWLAGCEGLFAVKGSEIRRYTWLDSPLPEAAPLLSTDQSQRLWVFSPGSPVLMIEDGEFRTVYDGGSRLFSVSRDGTAWVIGSEPFEEYSNVWARQVYPTLGPKIATPDPGVNAIAAGEGGSLWVGTSSGIYRWSGREWAGPFTPDVQTFDSDARQGVLYSSTERLRWNGTGLEREPLIADPSLRNARKLGFDARGRLLIVSDATLRWIEEGQVTESVPLSFTDLPIAAFGPDGALYLASAAGVSRLVDSAVTPLLGIRPFAPAAEFAWRRQAFGRTLAEPSRDVAREELANPSPEMIGVKVHVQGVAFAGFESTGVLVDGRELPSTWAEPAEQVSTFLRERGQSPLFELPETLGGPVVDPASAPLSDLYGYLEAGSCFGWGSTRQFWLVEAYPTDMTPTEREGLAADLRARYPAPPP